MNQDTVPTRQVRHPLYKDMVEVPAFYGRPQEVPQADVDAAVEVFKAWARSENHLEWMMHGYRALRAGIIRQSGGVNPDAMHEHDEAVAAFEGSCLHGFVFTGERNRTEHPILGTYRETAERQCKYCGKIDHYVVSASNYSGD